VPHEIALILLLSASPGQTLEIYKMLDIEREIVAGTLVVFDIDNTLIEPVQMLGSDQWFYALVDDIRREQVGEAAAVDRAMAIWNAVQSDTAVRAVEAATPLLILRLQRRGIPILALTARTSQIAADTSRQLRSVGIDFERMAVAGDLELGATSKLVGGVLYVGEHNSKGEVLVALMRLAKLSPKRVVFVDDKRKNVDSVSAALTSAKLPFVAYRYGAADQTVAAFRPEVAAIQYRWWRKIISDDAAQDLLEPAR